MSDQEYMQKLLKLLEKVMDSNSFKPSSTDEKALNSSLKAIIRTAKEVSCEKVSPEQDKFNQTTISFIEAFLEVNLKEKIFTGPFKKDNPAFLELLEDPSRLP